MLRNVASVAKRAASSAAWARGLKTTALYNLHEQYGASFTEFGGYNMPLRYKNGDIKPHLHCREQASLFDVSHMGQLVFRGEDRVAFMESLVPSELQKFGLNRVKYTCLMNEAGGIVDDCVVRKAADHLFVVVNAGTKEKDMAHFRTYMDKSGMDVSMEYRDDLSLLALQGPKAAEVLQGLVTEDLSMMSFMVGKEMAVDGVDGCIVTRCGYTGEDGFEVSMPNDKAETLAQALLAHESVEWAGLAARDSLRLEAGLCLYGHDVTDETSPVQAGISFVINKRRKEEGGFLGSDVVLRHLAEGAPTVRVGLLGGKGAPAREGAELLHGGRVVGTLTSGAYSPTLKRPLAMAYVPPALAEVGTKVAVEVRGRELSYEVAPMPFVAGHYYRAPKKAAAKK